MLFFGLEKKTSDKHWPRRRTENDFDELLIFLSFHRIIVQLCLCLLGPRTQKSICCRRKFANASKTQWHFFTLFCVCKQREITVWSRARVFECVSETRLTQNTWNLWFCFCACVFLHKIDGFERATNRWPKSNVLEHTKRPWRAFADGWASWNQFRFIVSISFLCEFVVALSTLASSSLHVELSTKHDSLDSVHFSFRLVWFYCCVNSYVRLPLTMGTNKISLWRSRSHRSHAIWPIRRIN